MVEAELSRDSRKCRPSLPQPSDLSNVVRGEFGCTPVSLWYRREFRKNVRPRLASKYVYDDVPADSNPPGNRALIFTSRRDGAYDFSRLIFGCLHVSATSLDGHVTGIVLGGSEKEMIGIAARRVVAAMANVKGSGVLSFVKKPRQPVGSPRFTARRHRAVPGYRVSCSSPFKAVPDFDQACTELLDGYELGSSRHDRISNMRLKWCQRG